MSAKKKKLDTTRVLLTIFLILAFLGCIAAIVYPLISTWYSEQVYSDIQTKYEEVIEDVDNSELDVIYQAAVEYNDRLYNGEVDLLDVAASGYYDQLITGGLDIMCYVRIPCIDVSLPVYHTTSEDALSVGAGHFPQSSLPVGGLNTHAAISAHSGMASAEMFSSLELMELGDVFYIDVLGQTLAYQVCEIETVLPEAISSVQIEYERDLVTLITCTPYGVNTHRLLVTGERIELPESAMTDDGEVIMDDVEVRDAGSAFMTHYIQALVAGLAVAVVIVLIVVIASRKHKQRSAIKQTRITWSIQMYDDSSDMRGNGDNYGEQESQ